MKINYKGEETTYVKKGTTLHLEVNGKDRTFNIESYASDFDLGGDLSWTVDEKLTSEEVEAVDDFIRNNY